MLLTAERRAPIRDPSERQVATTLAKLWCAGPSSFACLAAEDGGYVQVAGGRVTCLIERRWDDGRHARAHRPTRSTVFADGCLLVCGAGRIAMQADEWFTAAEATELFLAFRRGAADPAPIRWRDVTRMLAPPSLA